MDPDAALREIAELAAIIVRGNLNDYDTAREAERMAELFQGLDQWIRSGGFLPHAWKESSDAASQ